MVVEVRIPSLGESVSQGVIARWRKRDGDVVAADEILLDLETDKATMEIPAESAGLLEILEPEGATVSVGAVVARISDGAAQRSSAAPTRVPAVPVARGEASAGTPPSTPRSAPPSTAEEPMSPAVRKLVTDLGLDPAAISGSGKGGRLTKEDVLRYVAKSAEPPEAPKAAERAEPTKLPKTGETKPPEREEIERVPMTRLRRRIAERLVEAQRTAAILTTFNEIDTSAVVDLRKRYKERFQKTHGVGLGFMSLFGRACIQAIRDVPIINAQIDGEDVVTYRRVHLGIAVGTERGLVVPVVRDADRKSLAELERDIGELANLARQGKLLPDHLAGGTFTISNGGIYGSLLSTPILNPPQSAILGMHKIEERPVVVNGEIVIRPMMYVALSYDHRLIDGEQAVTFLVRVKERLEDPARLLLEI